MTSRRKRLFLQAILLIVIAFSIPKAFAQDITEANYLRLDSMLWAGFEKTQNELGELWNAMPEKQDSIRQVFDKIYEDTSQRNRQLAMQYASVPSGLQRLYMVRLDLPKDTISKVFNSLSTEMQESFYGKNIQAHLQTKQIEKGDTLHYFPCMQENEEEFNWNETTGKQLLILYGGLGCIGESGRNYLQNLYKNTSRDKFLIIIYWPVSSSEYLRKLKEQYPYEYILISDFKQDASPIKIQYGSQATPTCFLTDKNHVVLKKFTGVNPELIDPYLNIK